MAPKYLLQFDVEIEILLQEHNLNPGPVESKTDNRHRYDISKKWRQFTRKLIMSVALSAGSSLKWYWNLTELQYQSSLAHD